MKTLDGRTYEAMIVNGFKDLKTHYETVNELNVFPVPDGDTGTNICATLEGGVKAMKRANKAILGDVVTKCSEGMLLGARGNSGVITSQFFAGIAYALQGLTKATVRQFASALKNGTAVAYKAVPTPVEGTILTVAREGTDYVIDHINEIKDFETLFKTLLEQMKISLDRTPDLLPVLKEAGVIDSGGAGLLYTIEGMCKEIMGEEVTDTIFNGPSSNIDLNEPEAFNEDSKLDYGYCTEFILQLLRSKGDPAKVNLQDFIDEFSKIGDSIVAIKQNSIIKIHVHTKEPWKVIQYAQQYGEFVTFKMENMTIQHNEKLLKEMPIEGKGVKVSSDIKPEPLKHSKIQVIAVAPSPEIGKLFKDLGVAGIITGGQTMNPSAQDFVDKLDYVNADDVIIFPNNSNVIMTAEQAAGMYTKSKVHVMHSKSVVEAYSAMKMADIAGASVEENIQIMEEQMKSVVSMQISRSIRDSKNNGMTIRENDFIGIMGGKIVSHDRTIMKAVQKMVKNVPNMDEKSIITVFYGKNATEKMKVDLKKLLERLCPMMDIYEIDGGQPVYHFTIAFE